MDTERGEPTHFYDNCCYSASTRDRVPLITSPFCPHLAISTCTNGKGLTIFDLRMPLPADVLFELHDSLIRDVLLLDPSWSRIWGGLGHHLATISIDGTMKVCSMEGKVIHCLHVGHFTNCLANTPEPFNSTNRNGFRSILMLAGDQLSTYTPDKEPIPVSKFSLSTPPTHNSVQLPSHHHHHHLFSHRNQSFSPNSFYSSFQNNMTNLSINVLQPSFPPRNFPLTLNTPWQSSGITSSPRQSHLYNVFQAKNCAVQTMPLAQSFMKMKYTLNGGLLYAISEDYQIKKLRRYPNEHRIVSDVLTHNNEICDMDISPYDEFLVTASRDKTVGVLYLGPPNRGWTSCCQLTWILFSFDNKKRTLFWSARQFLVALQIKIL